VSQRSRLRSQDGFIREVIWIAVILGIIAVVILDGMAIFRAYQSADDAASAAEEAHTEYVQTLNAPAARLAAEQYLAKSGLEMTDYKAVQTDNGTVKFTVTATASADTYAFRYLGKIPQLKDWVERTTHPTRTGSAE
jgi:Flp pilus assembly protein TadG